MPSAYAEQGPAGGAEPEFTNHTVSGMNPEPFTGTLDYIFFSVSDCVVVVRSVTIDSVI